MFPDQRYVVSCLCLLLGVVNVAHSQDRQRRRQFLDGLLQTLIESQLPDPPATAQRAPSSAEAANARAVSAVATPKIREAARLLTQAADDMSQLVVALQSDIYRSQGVRQLLTEAMRVNANASALARRMAYGTDSESLREYLRQLDHDWQLMESELRPMNNRFIQRQTQRIEGANRQLHELLRYTAELDREDLLNSTRLLLQDLEQLMGQITLKMLVDLPGARNFAVVSAGDFEIACRDFAETAEAGDVVDTLRDLYLYLHDEWERLSISLRGIESQPVRRSLRDIGNSVDSIQAILGVVPEFDRDQALSLGSSITTAAKYIQGDLQQHFGRPNRYPREFQTDTLQTAARFQKASQLLYAGIANGNKLRQLKTDCDAVAAEWETLSRMVPRFDRAQQQRLGTYRRELTPQIVEMQTLLSL